MAISAAQAVDQTVDQIPEQTTVQPQMTDWQISDLRRPASVDTCTVMLLCCKAVTAPVKSL